VVSVTLRGIGGRRGIDGNGLPTSHETFRHKVVILSSSSKA
jgi:hypothetical protein